MQLERARIKNFRSLRDVEVLFDAHTALIDGNGAGKSSILKAIEKFYSTSKSCDADDFFGRDQGQPIEIELTFHLLGDQEVAAFEDRVRDGKLVVTRVFDVGNPSNDTQKIPEIVYQTLLRASEQGPESEMLKDLVRAMWRFFRNEEIPEPPQAQALVVVA